jgi:hypothetical protein
MSTESLPQVIQQHLENLPLTAQGEVLDFVLFLETRLDKKIASPLIEALDVVCKLNPFDGLDATAWQDDIRRDRIMPAPRQ